MELRRFVLVPAAVVIITVSQGTQNMLMVSSLSFKMNVIIYLLANQTHLLFLNYLKGSSNILRDCSITNEMPLFNATLSTGFQFHCDSNLCNSGYIGPASTPSTVPAEEFPNTFNPSSSASRGVLSWCHWSFGVAFYCLSSFIFFLDAYPNVLYHL